MYNKQCKSQGEYREEGKLKVRYRITTNAFWPILLADRP